MGSQNPAPLREERRFLRRFLLARAQHDLYDFDRVSRRDPRHETIAIVRAIMLVALAGGAIWFLLWKVALHILATR
jgi:hypothetical protein